MNTKFILLLLIINSYLCKESSPSLKIKKQGIFSSGGTVLHSEGTFDLSNYYTSRAGSTLHVDHSNVLYQITEDEKNFQWYSFMGMGNQEWDG